MAVNESLPSRERGLKYSEQIDDETGSGSLPSRERGLKLCKSSPFSLQILSLPSRERGLKLIGNPCDTVSGAVAPFAGAWIEICPLLLIDFIIWVAPFAGAWIEIETPPNNMVFRSCRSLRGSVD